MKFFLIMYICSVVDGNQCKVIQPKITEFKDHYSCAVHGYKASHDIIVNLNREFVNTYGAYVQFACTLKQEQNT